MQYLRLADAQARLSSCLIQHNGEPIYIDSVREDTPGTLVATGQNLFNKRNQNIVLNEVIITPPKFVLGYTNYFSNKTVRVVRMQRTPARRTQLGLCSANSFVTTLPGIDEEGRAPGWINVFVGTAFVNAQRGEYLSLKQVVDYGCGALSPDFAMKRVTLRAYNIFWEDNIIGEYDSKSQELTLYPQFAWCRETLERLMTEKKEAARVAVYA